MFFFVPHVANENSKRGKPLVALDLMRLTNDTASILGDSRNMSSFEINVDIRGIISAMEFRV
jgi:hypothetical protein